MLDCGLEANLIWLIIFFFFKRSCFASCIKSGSCERRYYFLSVFWRPVETWQSRKKSKASH
jgi:hypothetical protein